MGKGVPGRKMQVIGFNSPSSSFEYKSQFTDANGYYQFTDLRFLVFLTLLFVYFN